MFINFREWGRESTSIWERNMAQLPPVRALIGDWIHKLGMCFDQELNLQTCWFQDNAPTNWAIWLGQDVFILILISTEIYYSWLLCLFTYNLWKTFIKSRLRYFSCFSRFKKSGNHWTYLWFLSQSVIFICIAESVVLSCLQAYKTAFYIWLRMALQSFPVIPFP